MLTSKSAVISFDTDQKTKAIVEIREWQGKMRRIPTSSMSHHHEVRISSLTPSTKYFYRVIGSQGNLKVKSKWFHFTTAPAKGKRATFSFGVMTDSRGGYGGSECAYLGVNYKILRALFLDAQHKGASLIFFPGDLIEGFTTSVQEILQQFRAWKQSIEPVAHFLPIYEGMGNHEICIDLYDDGSRYGMGFDKRGRESTEFLFAANFVNPTNGPEPEQKGLPPYRENVYYVDYAQIRFVMLNTNYWISSFPEKYGGNLEGYILPKQMQWLKGVLDEAENSPCIQHVFVGMHEAIFPTNAHAKDGMWYNGGKPRNGYKRDCILQCRDELWKLLVDHSKVVAVICGDEHNYTRLRITKETPVYPDGRANPRFHRPLRIFITGGAGAPVYPLGSYPLGIPTVPWKDSIECSLMAHHYLLFSVTPMEITAKCIGRSGAVLDECLLWKASKKSLSPPEGK